MAITVPTAEGRRRSRSSSSAGLCSPPACTLDLALPGFSLGRGARVDHARPSDNCSLNVSGLWGALPLQFAGLGERGLRARFLTHVISGSLGPNPRSERFQSSPVLAEGAGTSSKHSNSHLPVAASVS